MGGAVGCVPQCEYHTSFGLRLVSGQNGKEQFSGALRSHGELEELFKISKQFLRCTVKCQSAVKVDNVMQVSHWVVLL